MQLEEENFNFRDRDKTVVKEIFSDWNGYFLLK